MTTEAQPQVVRSFLVQLETALNGVPPELGREIVAGIAEELAGLDEKTAAARVEELGDPAFIAAEARAGVSPAVTAEAPAGNDPRWYVVVAALLIAFGGVVIPVLGWIAGIVMVWLSKSWFGWEKWVATLTPIAFVVLVLLVSVVSRGLVAWHLMILLPFVIPIPVGIWLLVRGLRRAE